MSSSFPRTRGVVSKKGIENPYDGTFSPHTRGCILDGSRFGSRHCVFPAHAGLYRCFAENRTSKSSFPRTRGVVSVGCLFRGKLVEFSPHTRGCIRTISRTRPSLTVFPAHAGLYLLEAIFKKLTECFPRTRGVVSDFHIFPDTDIPFSPHTRGCIADKGNEADNDHVFPAHAGLYLAL